MKFIVTINGAEAPTIETRMNLESDMAIGPLQWTQSNVVVNGVTHEIVTTWDAEDAQGNTVHFYLCQTDDDSSEDDGK